MRPTSALRDYKGEPSDITSTSYSDVSEALAILDTLTQLLPRMAQITGYSVPPSEADVTPLYTSGSSSATAKAAPTKKFKPTPAAPALVATFSNVEMHNANQTQGSSESEISVVSSAERHNRLLLARAKRELAEARVHEAQAELDFATSSRAGSAGRLTDVRSEGGSSVRAPRRTDAAASLTQLDEVAEEPPTTTTRDVTDGYSDGARAPARGTPPHDCDADLDACTDGLQAPQEGCNHPVFALPQERPHHQLVRPPQGG